MPQFGLFKSSKGKNQIKKMTQCLAELLAVGVRRAEGAGDKVDVNPDRFGKVYEGKLTVQVTDDKAEDMPHAHSLEFSAEYSGGDAEASGLYNKGDIVKYIAESLICKIFRRLTRPDETMVTLQFTTSACSARPAKEYQVVAKSKNGMVFVEFWFLANGQKIDETEHVVSIKKRHRQCGVKSFAQTEKADEPEYEMFKDHKAKGRIKQRCSDLSKKLAVGIRRAEGHGDDPTDGDMHEATVFDSFLVVETKDGNPGDPAEERFNLRGSYKGGESHRPGLYASSDMIGDGESEVDIAIADLVRYVFHRLTRPEEANVEMLIRLRACPMKTPKAYNVSASCVDEKISMSFWFWNAIDNQDEKKIYVKVIPLQRKTN
jgi:hypothetical protein